MSRNILNFFCVSFLFVVIVAVQAQGAIIAPSVRASNQGTTDPTIINIRDKILQKETSIDFKRTLSLALASHDFQLQISSHPFSYNSIFSRWSFSFTSTDVQVILSDVNVVYSYRDPNGTGLNAVATEDAGITRVLNISTQITHSQYAGSRNSQTATGYEFYEQDSSGNKLPIYEITGEWTIPTASNPSGACSWNNCDIAPWFGLVNQLGGAGNCGGQSVGCIVQTGTDSGQYCTGFGCGPNHNGYYWGWYEYVPANPVHCWDDLNPGDLMAADVWNQYGFQSNGNPNNYKTQLYDWTLSRVCDSGWTNYQMGTPYYGEAIAERPQDTLPQFTTFPMYCDINTGKEYPYYQQFPGGPFSTCYDEYATNNGYWQVTMVNCAYVNAEVSGISPATTGPGSTWAYGQF